MLLAAWHVAHFREIHQITVQGRFEKVVDMRLVPESHLFLDR